MKKPVLIIIRGNSGSGKSTIAKRLQRELDYGTALIQQDVVRGEILRVHETPNNPSDALMDMIARFSKERGYDVIVDGIFRRKKHGDWLLKLIEDWEGPVFVYYLDIPFEETLKRHMTKPNAHEFGEKEMREWWAEHDYLGADGEIIITHEPSADEIVARIFRDVEQNGESNG